MNISASLSLVVSLMFRIWTRSKPSLHHLFHRNFNTISEPESLLFNIRTLCARGQLHEALSLFYAQYTPPLPQLTSISITNSQTYATLLQTCANHISLKQGQALHNYLLQTSNLKPNLFITNHLINFYAKCGCFETALQLFEEMPQRNLITWTSLITAYDQHQRPEECFSLFCSMLRYYLPTEFAFASVLSSCDLVRGRQVHSLALKTSFDVYVYVGNSLISMYYKNISEKDDGWLVFETMPLRNLITWNSVIAGLERCGQVVQSLELFSRMHRGGIGFDRVTLVSVLASFCCKEHEDAGNVLGFENCCQLHCLGIKTGFVWEVEIGTALVKAYSKLGGSISDCYKLFSETNNNKDIVSWTGIITIFAEKDPEEALSLFCQLRQEECLDPDCYTFSIVIKACAGFATEKPSLAVHGLVIKYGFEDDLVLANALIHTYARSGSIGFSEKVFDSMKIRNTISWNSMFKAYAVHGRGMEALDLFARMGIRPDSTTFVALLSACSHAGLVDQGTEIFETMFSDYGISPECDHFACMVDILGRAGRLVEAEALISRMPMEPDSVVWSALLGACRKHSETKMAERVSLKLMELEPKNSLGYVMMSNIYCSKGSFKDAAMIRMEMKGTKVRKEPGLSWIEIGNQVHEFASGGRRHPQKEAIYTELEVLIGRLKQIGYVPETSLALHDMEEEQKEEQLYYHSEKLALAFFMINAGSSWFVNGIIRIMKNIRICIDCHNFMKLASNLVQREIVVRDANRFHHFRNGKCSCSDYW